MSPPLVSVIIPTYNRSWGLRRAITSVLSQSYKSISVIVVDDCSQDDTSEVASSFSDSRIEYHRHKTNLGLARNWASGLSLARGEFVAFLMDDDWYTTDFLADRVSALARHNSASAAFSGYNYYDLSGSLACTQKPCFACGATLSSHQFLKATLSKDVFIGSTLYRADVVRQVMPEAVKYGIVVDFALNLFLAIRNRIGAVYVGSSHLARSLHSGQIGCLFLGEVFSKAAALLEDAIEEPLTNAERAEIRAELSHWYLMWARTGTGASRIRRIVNAIRVNPCNCGAWKQLAKPW